MVFLHSFFSSKLYGLPNPQANPKPWFEIMASYPGWWKSLLRAYGDNASSIESKNCDDTSTRPFKCMRCRDVGKHVAFMSQKALDQHFRIAHHVTSDLRWFVSKSLECPVCLNKFRSSTRLLAHFSDRRVKRSVPHVPSCNSILKEGIFPRVCADTFNYFREVDRKARNDAHHDGKTQPVVGRPSSRSLTWTPNPSSIRIRGKSDPHASDVTRKRSQIFRDDGHPRKRFRARTKVALHEYQLSCLVLSGSSLFP